MSLQQIVLAINTAGTLAIGCITFLIVYTTMKKMEASVMHEFTRRFLMVVSFLILYTSYLMFYNQFFAQQTSMAQYPLYIILVMVFLSMIHAAMGFEDIVKDNMSDKEKLEKMEGQELG